ncbi:MAG: response regulator transcription factor [Deltaproteobacteria bacterium]|nr:response regulator transcription factor [Deltaproteobacteria bacterium]
MQDNAVLDDPNVTRVLLAEDHQIVREGLRALLSASPDMLVVGEAADGEACILACQTLDPDVVVMDLSMPKLDGVSATRAVSAMGVRVLVLSMHGGDEYVRPAMRAGARGFVLKGAGLAQLVEAIRCVSRGDTYFGPGIQAPPIAQDPPRDEDPGLTPREREVLQLVASGRSSSDIAAMLSVSPKTVETHRARIMTKLRAPNSASLVRAAIRLGLVPLDDP